VGGNKSRPESVECVVAGEAMPATGTIDIMMTRIYLACMLMALSVNGCPVAAQEAPDLEKLPAMVKVGEADLAAQVTYDVPRAAIKELFRDKLIVWKPVAPYGYWPQFRFVTPEAALRWFEQAQPVPALPASVARGALRPGIMPITTADGRAWHGGGGEKDVDDIKRQVEAGFAGKRGDPHIVEGAYVWLGDSKGRLWLSPRIDAGLLLGYNPKTKEWQSHRRDKNAVYRLSNDGLPTVYETASGVLLFLDTTGLQVLQGEEWTFQSLYARNIRENKRVKGHYAFSPLQFAEDGEGRAFVWSGWNESLGSGTSGTIGFWVFDGTTWRNEDAVERLLSVVPRSGGDVWLVTAENRLALMREGRFLEGEDAQVAMKLPLRFKIAWPVTKAPNGTAYIRLEKVEMREPVESVPFRAIAIPRRGPIKDLGSRAGEILRQNVVAGPDGRIWAPGVVAWSADMQEISREMGLRYHSYTQITGVDQKGIVYFSSGSYHWRLDPTGYDSIETATPHLPAMRVSIEGLAWPDSQGRLWCRRRTDEFPRPNSRSQSSTLSYFDKGSWTFFPKTREEAGHSLGVRLAGATAGANGAMVFFESNHFYHLYDGGNWFSGANLQEFVQYHAAPLRQALKYPAAPATGRISQMVTDADGNVWWGRWFYDWGVVSGEKLIDGNQLDIDIGPNGKRSFSVFTPIGDGRQLLVGDEEGHTAVVALRNGRIVKIGNAPVKLSGRAPDDSDWHRGVLRDGQGRVWLTNSDSESGYSNALGPTGQLVAKHAGRLMLEDKSGGLWFVDTATAGGKRLIRLARDGSEATLARWDLGQSLAEAPDGSVWALTLNTLLRIAFDKGALTIVEEYPLVSGGGAGQIWCDPEGRVWHWQPGNERSLIRYATGSGVATKSKTEEKPNGR